MVVGVDVLVVLVMGWGEVDNRIFFFDLILLF